jgi:hypothetical protein
MTIINLFNNISRVDLGAAPQSRHKSATLWIVRLTGKIYGAVWLKSN